MIGTQSNYQYIVPDEENPQRIALAVSEIRLDSTPSFRRELMRYLHEHPGDTVLDVSGLDYTDTSGIATLIQAEAFKLREGSTLKLDGLHGEPEGILENTRLKDLFLHPHPGRLRHQPV